MPFRVVGWDQAFNTFFGSSWESDISLPFKFYITPHRTNSWLKSGKHACLFYDAQMHIQTSLPQSFRALSSRAGLASCGHCLEHLKDLKRHCRFSNLVSLFDFMVPLPLTTPKMKLNKDPQGSRFTPRGLGQVTRSLLAPLPGGRTVLDRNGQEGLCAGRPWPSFASSHETGCLRDAHLLPRLPKSSCSSFLRFCLTETSLHQPVYASPLWGLWLQERIPGARQTRRCLGQADGRSGLSKLMRVIW